MIKQMSTHLTPSLSNVLNRYSMSLVLHLGPKLGYFRVRSKEAYSNVPFFKNLFYRSTEERTDEIFFFSRPS